MHDSFDNFNKEDLNNWKWKYSGQGVDVGVDSDLDFMIQILYEFQKIQIIFFNDKNYFLNWSSNVLLYQELLESNFQNKKRNRLVVYYPVFQVQEFGILKFEIFGHNKSMGYYECPIVAVPHTNT